MKSTLPNYPTQTVRNIELLMTFVKEYIYRNKIQLNGALRLTYYPYSKKEGEFYDYENQINAQISCDYPIVSLVNKIGE